MRHLPSSRRDPRLRTDRRQRCARSDELYRERGFRAHLAERSARDTAKHLDAQPGIEARRDRGADRVPERKTTVDLIMPTLPEQVAGRRLQVIGYRLQRIRS